MEKGGGGKGVALPGQILHISSFWFKMSELGFFHLPQILSVTKRLSSVSTVHVLAAAS